MFAIDRFDWTILDWLNTFALRHPSLDWLVARSTENDLVKLGLPIVVLWHLWFGRRPSAEEARSRIIMALMSVFLALFIGRVLAEALPFRPRPCVAPGHKFRTLVGVQGGIRSWSSFPSDHALVGFALATGIGFIVRWLGALALLHAVVIICMPRLYLGWHYPTDLLGGGVLGIVLTCVLNADRVRVPVARWFLAWERRSPGNFYAALFLLTFEIARMFDDIRRPVAAVFRMLHDT